MVELERLLRLQQAENAAELQEAVKKATQEAARVREAGACLESSLQEQLEKRLSRVPTTAELATEVQSAFDQRLKEELAQMQAAMVDDFKAQLAKSVGPISRSIESVESRCLKAMAHL